MCRDSCVTRYLHFFFIVVVVFVFYLILFYFQCCALSKQYNTNDINIWFDILPFFVVVVVAKTLFNILHFYGTYLPRLYGNFQHNSLSLFLSLSLSLSLMLILLAAQPLWKHRKFVVSLSCEENEQCVKTLTQRRQNEEKANDSRHTIETLWNRFCFFFLFRVKTTVLYSV